MEIEEAKKLINDFCLSAYGKEADFSNMIKIPLASATVSDGITDKQRDLRVFACLDYHYGVGIITMADDRPISHKRYASIDDFVRYCLSDLSIGKLTEVDRESWNSLRYYEVMALGEPLFAGDFSFIKWMPDKSDFSGFGHVVSQHFNTLLFGDKVEAEITRVIEEIDEFTNYGFEIDSVYDAIEEDFEESFEKMSPEESQKLYDMFESVQTRTFYSRKIKEAASMEELTSIGTWIEGDSGMSLSDKDYVLNRLHAKESELAGGTVGDSDAPSELEDEDPSL